MSHTAEPAADLVTGVLAAFRQATAALAVTRGADHVVIFASDAFGALAPGAEPVGRTVAELGLERVLELLDRVRTTGEAGSFRAQSLDRPGEPKTCEDWLALPWKGRDGELAGVVLVVSDVSADVEANSRLQALVDELQARNEELHAQSEELQAQSEEIIELNDRLRRSYEEVEAQVARRTDELQRERDFLAALLDTLSDAIVACDDRGEWTLANPATRRLLGVEAKDPAELAAVEEQYFQPDGRTPIAPEARPLNRALRGEVVREAPMVVRTREGEARHVLATSQPISASDGRRLGAVAALQDVTERRRAAALLERHARHVAMRAEIGEALVAMGTVRELLQRCTDAIVRHLGAAFARIWTLDEAGEVLELQASSGMYTHIDGGHARVPVGKFKIGLIAQEGRPHLTNDVLNDPRIGDPDWARREGMVAFAGYPLIVDGRVTGVMALFAREPLELDTLDALASVADALAQGNRRKRLEERLQLANEELTAQTEELTAANEELAMQAEEINQANEELAAQGRLLAEQSSFAEALVDNQAGGFAYIDRDLVFRRVNQTHARLFQRTPEDFIGRHVYDVFAGTEDQVGGIFQTVLHEGRPWSQTAFPFQYEDEHGAHETYWDVSIVPFLGQDGKPLGLITNAFEVSERVRLERMRTRDARLAALRADLGEALGGAAAIADGLRRVASLVMTHLGLAAVRIEAGEPGGLEPCVAEASADPQADAPAHTRELPLAPSGVTLGRMWLASREPLSELQESLADGAAEALAAGIERMQALAALRQSEERFRVLFDQAAVGMAIVDRDARLLGWNRAFETLLGRTGEALVGASLFDIGRDEDRAEDFRSFDDLLTGQIAAYQVERRFPREGAGELRADVTVARTRPMPGLEAFALVTLQDVGARVEAAKAREASRLKSEFLANMSHELRTPLNSIIGYTELVTLSPAARLDDRSRTNLDVVLRNAHHLLALINDILDLSKVEAGKLALFPEPVSPGGVIRAVLASLEPLAREKGLWITLDLDEALEQVEADETKLRQIVLNLVSNAIKFTPAGGVTIATRAAGPERWTLAIRDTGIGIAPEHHALVFEEFRQVDSSASRQSGGTGLGLAIARKLAKLMGGDVRLESALGHGATFTLELPRQLAPLAEGGRGPAAPEGRAQRVALVTTDEALVAALRRTLAGTAHEVVPVRAAADFARVVRSERPDVIALDLAGPPAEMWAVLHAIKTDVAVAGAPVCFVRAWDGSSAPTDGTGRGFEELLAALERRDAETKTRETAR